MILGKRKDTGKWQVLTHPQSIYDVRADGAWSRLLHVKANDAVEEYVPAQPKWELSK